MRRGEDGRWTWAVFDGDDRLVAVSPPGGYRQADEAELEIRRLVSGIFAGLVIVRDDTAG